MVVHLVKFQENINVPNSETHRIHAYVKNKVAFNSKIWREFNALERYRIEADYFIGEKKISKLVVKEAFRLKNVISNHYKGDYPIDDESDEEFFHQVKKA